MTSSTLSVRPRGAVKGPNMEGFIASWYAKNTAGSIPEFEDEARRFARTLKAGDCVLEVAPGPGYLAIALAKQGDFRVTGIDISHTFVRIAQEAAVKAGAHVEFRQGNASALPFAANWFDFLVCRAAFKNFADPVGALREMHRVLRPGGRAVIIDMRKDASDEEIREEVSKMGLGMIGAYVTRWTLRDLRRRAYTESDFNRMIADTPFGSADVKGGGIGFEITLVKAA